MTGTTPGPRDFDWFLTLVAGAGSVLDPGCGTGIFSAELAARGAEVVGVDPAAAMLNVARVRQEQVTWIEAPAQGLALGRRFEAVVMTGHAFQTLLTAEDRAACLETIVWHLAPGGRFFLDSRNPAACEWEAWSLDATRVVRRHDVFGWVERWIVAAETEVPGIIEYTTHYRLPDGTHLQARSQIGFPGFDELSGAIAAAGLRVDRWYGDAAGRPAATGMPGFYSTWVACLTCPKRQSRFKGFPPCRRSLYPAWFDG